MIYDKNYNLFYRIMNIFIGIIEMKVFANSFLHQFK